MLFPDHRDKQVLCHHPVWRSNGEQTILVGFTFLFCFLALNKLVNKLQERLEATRKNHPSRKQRDYGPPSISTPPVNAPRWAVEKSYRHNLRGAEDCSSSCSTSTPGPSHSTPTNTSSTLPYYTETYPSASSATIVNSQIPSTQREVTPSRGRLVSPRSCYTSVQHLGDTISDCSPTSSDILSD